jgi:hypothetical protein
MVRGQALSCEPVTRAFSARGSSERQSKIDIRSDDRRIAVVLIWNDVYRLLFDKMHYSG